MHTCMKVLILFLACSQPLWLVSNLTATSTDPQMTRRGPESFFTVLECCSWLSMSGIAHTHNVLGELWLSPVSSACARRHTLCHPFAQQCNGRTCTSRMQSSARPPRLWATAGMARFRWLSYSLGPCTWRHGTSHMSCNSARTCMVDARSQGTCCIGSGPPYASSFQQ